MSSPPQAEIGLAAEDIAPDILNATWSDVAEQFWLVQQKEAVAFYQGKTNPPEREWPEPLVEMPLDFIADCVEYELGEDRMRLNKEALSMVALAAHARCFPSILVIS